MDLLGTLWAGTYDAWLPPGPELPLAPWALPSPTLCPQPPAVPTRGCPGTAAPEPLAPRGGPGSAGPGGAVGGVAATPRGLARWRWPGPALRRWAWGRPELELEAPRLPSSGLNYHSHLNNVHNSNKDTHTHTPQTQNAPMVGIWLVQRRGVRHSHVCCETAFGSVIISILVSERQKTWCFGEKCPSCSGVTGVHILQTRSSGQPCPPQSLFYHRHRHGLCHGYKMGRDAENQVARKLGGNSL